MHSAARIPSGRTSRVYRRKTARTPSGRGRSGRKERSVFALHSAAAGALATPSLAAPSPSGGEPTGDPQPPAEPSPVPEAGRPCVCGHGRTAHEHYRRGKDCALCSCARYRRRLIGRRRR
jgi:hypothetical protein